ncbi:hypothetical protein SI65_05924 [Aspergillus cristatus]|uniref:Uncharacterized protein n=1 Tax=Aspergillus cristatus TaxID=573508 RepID=A0A1E3BEE6_ASPCR|nr:hypothetical protein SI65_05924 [Aspergillus cristatus]
MSLTSPSSELALGREFPPHQFKNIGELKHLVSEKIVRLDQYEEDQYLSFCNVSPEAFHEIEESREDHSRYTYFPDIQTLVIKLTTTASEKWHRSLGTRIFLKVTSDMGMGYDEFMPIAASTVVGQGSSSKEGDSGWTNLEVRSGAADWPGLVIQAGVSRSGAGYEGECLACLRADARWLLEHSQGQVNIVLLLWIEPASKKVIIEKWISGPQLTSSRFNVLRSAKPASIKTPPRLTLPVLHWFLSSMSGSCMSGPGLCSLVCKLQGV